MGTISLPDARSLSDEVLEALRLRALRGCELGFTEAEVADILGVARETVCRWWTAYATQGIAALPHERSGRPVGSGRTLDDEMAQHLQNLIDNNTPEKLGIAAPLWSRAAVRDLIRKEYDIDMPVRTVGEYLKRWGYTAKTPTRHARNQDPEEVREWLEETYPKIEERASQEDAQIHFCDETGVAADQHPHKGYARRGKQAIMDVPKPHMRINVISTITNEGDIHFMTYDKTMTAARFIVFLEQLLRTTTGKIFLVTDRLSAHDAAATWAWLARHKDRIEMFFLPRYSPEVNPDEYFNNDLKGNVHAEGLPDSKAELRTCVEEFLDHLRWLPDHVMSYFQHPCAQYAAGG
jgi:transposase